MEKRVRRRPSTTRNKVAQFGKWLINFANNGGRHEKFNNWLPWPLLGYFWCKFVATMPLELRLHAALL